MIWKLLIKCSFYFNMIYINNYIYPPRFNLLTFNNLLMFNNVTMFLLNVESYIKKQSPQISEKPY